MLHHPADPGDPEVRCPACGAKRFVHIFEVETIRPYEIVRCADCRLVFSQPRPSRQQLSEFYSSTYFKRSSNRGLGYADYEQVAELNARRMWSVLNTYAPVERCSPKRVLDVGCATGGFLSEAKAAGWDCVGVELSEAAVEIARRKFGLHVICGDLGSDALQRASFGLITMWHVLEHLIDPAEGIRRAINLLAPGALLFIELPNWNSVGRVLRRTKWAQLKPPEHINFFNSRSLTNLIKRAGLDVVRCTTHYPSLVDGARVRRASRPLRMLLAAAAVGACRVGRGGYLRLLGRRVA